MNQPINGAALQATYEQLKKVRESKTCVLKPNPMLRTEIVGLDGQPQPFRLRYYQVQGIFHLLSMKRMVLGDGTGLGKTIEAIGALCYLWMPSKEPRNKVIVVTPKSALRQWAAEIQRFTTGVRTYLVTGTAEERQAVYEAWANAPTGPDAEKAVLILNYHLLIRDWDQGRIVPTLADGRPDPKGVTTPGLLDRIIRGVQDLVVIFDEAAAFKNTSTKTWQTCRFLSLRANRVYGLTATLLKNNLIEGYSIYKVIHPDVFTTKTKFMDLYCVTRMQFVGGRRKIPLVVGYKNLQHFRERIDPFFLGRPKHAVSDELPTLITKEIPCELSTVENAKYSEALTGVLELGDGTVRDYEDYKAFVALIYCQQVADSLHLLGFKEGSGVLDRFAQEIMGDVAELGSKEEALLDLLTGELEGEKVIIYTRFESLVGRLQAILTKAKIKSVRITGKEKDDDRRAAQVAFQDTGSDVRVIFITDAGSEAINLQIASAMIFYDAPWSWGNYVQTIGRMIRIGSPHQHVVVYHLVAERPATTLKDRRTIDHYTLGLLRGKKDLIDQVLGEVAVGALDFDKGQGFVRNLVREMKGTNTTQS